MKFDSYYQQLENYYTGSEHIAGLKSNFGSMLYCLETGTGFVDGSDHDSYSDWQLKQIAQNRIIRTVLAAIPIRDAYILQIHFSERIYPKDIAQKFEIDRDLNVINIAKWISPVIKNDGSIQTLRDKAHELLISALATFERAAKPIEKTIRKERKAIRETAIKRQK